MPSDTNQNNFARAASVNEFVLNRWYTCGRGEEVILIRKNTGASATIITKSGKFAKFPDIICEDFWTEQLGEGSILPEVHYRTEFDTTDDGYWMVLWTVQPDGRYWEDDEGFGGNGDPEIILYSYLAVDGGFIQPFQIYRVGSKKYY